MKVFKNGGRKLQLNRETLLRIDGHLPMVQGAATGTCAGSGCPDCVTLHGTGCISKDCPVDQGSTTIVVV